MAKIGKYLSSLPAAIAFSAIVVFTTGCENQDTTQIEENKATARLWIEEVWNKENIPLMDEICTTDFKMHWSGGSVNVEERKKTLPVFFAAFPDQQFNIEDIFAVGDKVTIYWTWSGTNTGKFLGNPPTGKHASVSGINIFRIAHGKIAEQWTGWNIFHLYQQLGYTLVPPEEQSSE